MRNFSIQKESLKRLSEFRHAVVQLTACEKNDITKRNKMRNMRILYSDFVFNTQKCLLLL